MVVAARKIPLPACYKKRQERETKPKQNSLFQQWKPFSTLYTYIIRVWIWKNIGFFDLGGGTKIVDN